MQLSPDYHRYFAAYVDAAGNRQNLAVDAAVIGLVGKSPHETSGGDLPPQDDGTRPVGIEAWAIHSEGKLWVTTVVAATGLAQIKHTDEQINGVFAPWASVTGIEITSIRELARTTDPYPVWRPIYRINTLNGPIDLGEGDKHERVVEIVRSKLRRAGEADKV